MALTPGSDSQGAESQVGVDEEPTKTAGSECSTPASAGSGDQVSTSDAALRHNTPAADPALSGTPLGDDSRELDTTTFHSHAVQLLPSEPNGTWRTQVSYAVTSPSKSAPTLREVYQGHGPQLDVPTLLHRLKETAKGRKDNVEGWLNQTLADQDLGEKHNGLMRSLRVPSMPNMRQIGLAVDAMSEFGQSLRKRRSESELLEKFRYDKYIFAEVVCRKAERALIEQGICKKWQLQCKNYVQLQHAMLVALLRTSTRIQQAYMNMPLFRAQPQWIAKRETKVWRLELDVGVVGVEVGPVTDRSLIELGFIDTEFELPESCGCAPIADIDRQAQGVEDEWQLLEA
ncbi:uncharacterized protein M421DRAFT_7814 [Didymella exigua CBS 183.55]|uniref:Uncharacterized protein n=1 Tax=Didymella exigua CBS 183.55 TaxID=1150837 RepID=A0A6A5REM7_9PLEO|nr:uncharacterized protein M421DRAFT_7814 [Didymella exigua CBS 183.55]KAF1925554.1 hypothetical protein M421DRAFT_7814 [Didymella exigua CBS 183.55]